MSRIAFAALLALALPAGAAEERIISKRTGDYAVQLTLRPGDPKPGRLLEIQIEVARVPDFPDPVYGDRVPVNDANLVVQLAPALADVAGGKSKIYRAHLVSEGGVYGVHTIPETAGIYAVAISPRTGPGPKVSFDIGVGVPMATEAGEGKKGASRRPAAGAGGGRMVVSSVGPKTEMREIGERWGLLETMAGTGSLALAGAQGEAKAIAALFGKAKSKPPKSANPADELNEMLDGSAAAFTAIAAVTDAKQLPALVAATEQSCMKCHVKYRWEMTRDLSRWPKFDIAERTQE